MRKRTVVAFLLCCALNMTAVAQNGATNSSDAIEIASFRTFIEQHPRALALLKQNPAALRSTQFAEQFHSVGEYLAQHPKVKELAKNDPHFFDNLTANSKASGGHKHGWW